MAAVGANCLAAVTAAGGRPPKPEMQPFCGLPDIPALRELQAQAQWVGWEYVWVEKKGGGGSDERDFFDERTEVKTHSLTCPNCQQTADYALSWLVRRKRARLTGYADAAREAGFTDYVAKVQRDQIIESLRQCLAGMAVS